MSEVGERRPIAARGWRGSILAASVLARSGVSANAISVAGMICGIGAGVTLAATGGRSAQELGHGLAPFLWLIAALLVQLRLVANMLDGMVAVATETASRLGELFNEIPDRVSDTAVLIGFGCAASGDPLLGAVAALVAMLTAYIRAVGKGAGVGQQFCGPMAKQQRMFVVTLVALVGVADPGQTLLIPHVGASVVGLALWLIILGGLVTALRRLLRIAAAL